MYYLAGKTGVNTIHRDKGHVDFTIECLDWSLKQLQEEIE